MLSASLNISMPFLEKGAIVGVAFMGPGFWYLKAIWCACFYMAFLRQSQGTSSQEHASTVNTN